MLLLLAFATCVIIFLRSLPLLYLFQIKEYRLDRLTSTLHETGWTQTLYFLPIKLPKYSLRNLGIISFIILALLLLFLASIEQHIVTIALVLMLPFGPYVSLGILLAGVYLTSIPVGVYRTLIVYRAAQRVRNSHAKFICITGSFGKTSVKEYLYQVLSKKFKVAKTELNMNTDIGIALSILKNLTPHTEICIIEVGAYRKGEIFNATWYIPFSCAILTGLGNQHLDLYGSREALVAEETSPLTRLDQSDHCYVFDETSIPAKVRTSIRAAIVSYSNHNSQIRMKIHRTQSATSVWIQYKTVVYHIKSMLLGNHSFHNLMPVVACAADLGMSPHQIVEEVSALKPIPGKMSLHTGKSKCTVIHDGMTTNVDGFLSAVETLAHFPQHTKYIVTQGIIELGGEKESSYEQIMKMIQSYDILLLTTDRLFKKYDNEGHVMTFNDVSSLELYLKSHTNKHTVILIEGRFPDTFIKSVINPTNNT